MLSGDNRIAIAISFRDNQISIIVKPHGFSFISLSPRRKGVLTKTKQNMYLMVNGKVEQQESP